MEALARRGSSPLRASSPPKSRGAAPLCAEPSEWPSGHYQSPPGPSTVLLRRAAEPPHPALPKQKQPKQLPKTMRERIPLAASLTGAGRAGKVGCLAGSKGSMYRGQVLAGRPHGKGQYWAPAAKPGSAMRLVYEGDFCKGAREGQGTAYEHSGEVYTGSWQLNKRTGSGRLTYLEGSMYVGMWREDVRHGVGTFYHTSGDIFVGTFVDGKRHGLGTTYMPSTGKKYVAEYVNDCPRCGSFFELGNDAVEPPPSQQLRGTIAAGTLRQHLGSQQAPSQLPVLQLSQPSKVLAKAFVTVRQQRKQLQPGSATAAAAAGDSTLPADSISLLRHAFILIAGGDDSAAFVLPHQLQELMVLAGLDPAAAFVMKLLDLLRKRSAQASAASGSTGDARLHLEDFLGVVCFFRQQPLEVLQHEQVQQAAAEAAAREAAAAAADEHGEAEEQQQQQQFEGDQEEWQEHEHGSDTELAAAGDEAAAEGSSRSVWGAATDEGILERHIEQHRSRDISAAAASTPELEQAESAAAGATEVAAAAILVVEMEPTEPNAAVSEAAASESAEAEPDQWQPPSDTAGQPDAAELAAAESDAAEASLNSGQDPDTILQLQQPGPSGFADLCCCASNEACEAGAEELQCQAMESSPATSDSAAASENIGDDSSASVEDAGTAAAAAAEHDVEAAADSHNATAVREDLDDSHAIPTEDGEADADVEATVASAAGAASEDAVAATGFDEAEDVGQEAAAVVLEETAQATAGRNANTVLQ